MKDAGYRVGLAGKTHASPASSYPWEYIKGNLSGRKVSEFIARDDEQPFCLFLCSHNAHAPWNQGDASRFDPDKIHLAPTQHDNPETREVMTRYLAEVDEQNDPGAAMDDPAVLKALRSSGCPAGKSSLDLSMILRFPRSEKDGRLFVFQPNRCPARPR